MPNSTYDNQRKILTDRKDVHFNKMEMIDEQNPNTSFEYNKGVIRVNEWDDVCGRYESALREITIRKLKLSDAEHAYESKKRNKTQIAQDPDNESKYDVNLHQVEGHITNAFSNNTQSKLNENDKTLIQFKEAVQVARRKMDEEIHWVNNMPSGFNKIFNDTYNTKDFNQLTLDKIKHCRDDALKTLEAIPRYNDYKTEHDQYTQLLVEIRLLDDKLIEAFINIYNELHKRESGFKISNFAKKLNTFHTIEEKLEAIKNRAADPKNRSHKALELAKENYENYKSNPQLLNQEIVYAHGRSFFSMTNIRGEKLFLTSTVKKMLDANPLTIEEVNRIP